jgi:hypothetical protein
MSKALVALALMSVLALIVIGGCAKSPAQAAPSTGEQAVNNNTITGQIQEVDKLNSELTDPGLEDINSQLNDISW